MTYLEAAKVILGESGVPLHYRAITKRALERGLIQPSGQTPDATMGAQLYAAVKKAEELGDQGGFRFQGKAHFSLALPLASEGIESAIGTQNSKVASELLDFLREMHPRQLELIVGRLLEQIGFEDVKVTQYVGDGGIDVEATLTVGGVTRVRTAVQVKRFKEGNKIGAPFIRELRGSLVTDQRGLIITTSGFGSGAVEEAVAAGKTPISLIDGQRLVELLMQHEIGAKRGVVHLYRLNLDDLISEEPDDAAGTKSAALWPLPGGHEKFFETLLLFVDQIGSHKPNLDEMTAWVLKQFETVTKQAVVQSYLRAVLASLDLVSFDGDRIVLTAAGEALRSKREQSVLLTQLKSSITGVVELLDLLAKGPVTLEQAHDHLTTTSGVKWDTDTQVRTRLQWLAAAGAVEKDGKGWRLARSTSVPPHAG